MYWRLWAEEQDCSALCEVEMIALKRRAWRRIDHEHLGKSRTEAKGGLLGVYEHIYKRMELTGKSSRLHGANWVP
jgi:hypothetical protein